MHWGQLFGRRSLIQKTVIFAFILTKDDHEGSDPASVLLATILTEHDRKHMQPGVSSSHLHSHRVRPRMQRPGVSSSHLYPHQA